MVAQPLGPGYRWRYPANSNLTQETMNLIRQAILHVAVFTSTQLLVFSTSIFPGSPLTLEELWLDSTFVGLVNVTSIDVISRNQIDVKKHVAVSVEQAFKKGKGTPDEFIAKLLLHRDPNPFDLLRGHQYLIFIKHNKKRDTYAIVSATKMEGNTSLLYSERLSELPVILSIENKSELNNQLLDWYIKCAKAPELRGDGAWGISSLRQRKRAKLNQAQCLQIVEILTTENPPGENSAALFGQVSDFPNKKLDNYLLESLRRSHEIGWSEVTRPAVETLPGRLNITLNKSTNDRIEESGELISYVFYRPFDPAQKPADRQRDTTAAKERLDVLWGSLSREIYLECEKALANSNQ
ncbi:hypothetical protein N9048_00435 [bacterium]|nr:hypothetical protein [bacterium]